MPTIIDLGQKVKQKYPGVYDDLSDNEVGQKVKQKYPGSYDDFADVEQGTFRYNVPAVVTPPPTPESRADLKRKAIEESVAYQNKSDRDNSTLGIIKNTITGLPKAFINTVGASEIGLGETIGKIAGAKNLNTYNKNITDLVNSNINTQKLIKQYEAAGKDATKLKNIYNSTQDLIDENKKEIGDYGASLPSTEKVVGQLGGTALDLLTAGTYGKAATSMKSARLSKSSLPFVKKVATTVSPALGQISTQAPKGLFTLKGLGNVAKGAGIGYGYDVTSGLQGFRGEDREGAASFVPGLGTAIGAAFPIIAEGTQTVKNLRDPEFKATKLAEKRKIQLDKLDKYSNVNKAVLKGQDRGIDIKKVLSETDVLHGAADKTGHITTKGEGNAVELYTKQYIDGNEAIVSDILKKEGRSMSADAVRVKLNKAVMDAGIEGAALTQARSKIDDEIAGYALRAGSTGTIPVETLHNAKIDKYNNINFFTEGNTKKYDKTVAKALKELVQENTTSVDVQKVNEELSKHFAVIDYLNKLDGKKVDGGKLGKYFAQTTGAIIGSHFGPLGAIGGAEAGARIKGNMMSKVFDGKTGKTLPTSDIMNEATRVRDAAPMQLPQSSNSLGNRNISQSTTIIPIKNSISNIIPQKGSLEYTLKDIASSGHDFDKMIQSGDLPMEAIYKNSSKVLQPARADHIISDIANKLDDYSNGLGNKFKSLVNKENVTPTNLIDEATKLLKEGKLGATALGGVQVSKKALELTKANGGATINLDGDVPTKGFAYSPFKDVETVIPKEKFGENHVDDFINKHFDKLNQDGHHLGIWEDDGKIYIDISKVNPDEQLAVADSIKNNQLGLFDLSTFETKYIKDYEKINNAYTHKGQNQGASKEGSIGTIAKEASKEINKTWYHGTDSLNKKNGDIFYSASKDIAGDFGKVSKIKDLPKNPLIIGSKEDLAPVIGYKGDPLVEPKMLKGKSFDELAKEYAKSKGHDSIMYESGTFDEPELHVFKNINPESGQIRMDVLQKGAKISTVATAAALVFKKLQDKFGTVKYKAADQPKAALPKAKTINDKDLADALIQLESSGGKDKRSADNGEYKWLTGLTSIAIKELKRTGIKNSVNVNSKEDVIDASVKYFKLLQKRNPNLTPAEVYVQKYWTNPNDLNVEQKKVDQFNKLAKI